METTAQVMSREERKDEELEPHTFFGTINDSLITGRRARRRHTTLDGSVKRGRLRALAAEVCSLASYRRRAIEDTILSAAGNCGQGDVDAVLCDGDSAVQERERV